MFRDNLTPLFRWSVILVGILAALLAIFVNPVRSATGGLVLLAGFFFAVLVFFPVELISRQTYWFNVLALPAGILLGRTTSLIAAIAGILGGCLLILVYWLQKNRSSAARRSGLETLLQAAFLAASIAIPLTVSLNLQKIYPAEPGLFSAKAGQPDLVVALIGLVFILVHASILLLDRYLGLQGGKPIPANETIAFLGIELLPLPLALLVAGSAPAEAAWVFTITGVCVVAGAIIANRVSIPRSLLERRARELSTLNEISQTISTSTNLDMLLESVHQQIAQVLNVDNFYVALLDPADRQVWYPLAIKHGQRQVWQRRPLADRLTDRVIQTGKPILLPHHARQELAHIGLPPSEDAPYAWVGVPLTNAERVTGCLAAFSFSAESEFTKADLNFLTILAGQASVAIEIALHNALLSSDVTIGRDRLSAVLNSVNEGILLIEGEGQITLVNEAMARISQLPQSEFLGKRLPDLSRPGLNTLGLTAGQAGSLQDEIQDSVDGLDGSSVYTVAERLPPQVIERNLVPIASEPGTLSGWMLVVRDITEEQQNRAARDLLSETLVHDIRSPIGAVLAALDVIEEANASGDSGEVIRASVGIAQRSGRRVLDLVESMLEITRLQSGSVNLDLERVSLRPLVAHALLEYNVQASEYGIALVNDVPDNLPEAWIDLGKIQRVLANLIDNALKFTPAGGSIVIRASADQADVLTMRVSDSGPGIPEEYREKIFERFAQVPGRSPRRRGTGLGLAYCRLAVNAHNCRIWVEPNQPAGSSFSFTLPVAKPAGF